MHLHLLCEMDGTEIKCTKRRLTCMLQERTHKPGGRRVVTVVEDSDNTEAKKRRKDVSYNE
jgi:hypothetical protein